MSQPYLSVVVVTYRMYREIERTLFTLAPPYQRGITRDEFEVIVVDNGSEVPPTAEDFAHLELDLTVLTTPDPSPSPVRAVNRGLNHATGAIVGVLIDGARMSSPGLLHRAREAMRISPRAVVAARGRYLGYEAQRDAIAKGYDFRVEDFLLERSGWWHDGYRLFNISVFDESSGPTWYSSITESNALFMRRSMWAELGGYDLAFDLPGGGLANLDTWRRACQLPGARPIVLLGEATFHQVHGGVATNGSTEVIDGFFRQYEEIRGHPFDFSPVPITVHGEFVTWPLADELVPVATEAAPPAPSRWRPVIDRVTARFGDGFRQTTERLVERAAETIRYGPRGAAARRADYAAVLAAVASSDYFDADWYRCQYPEVEASGLEPHEHLVRHGLDPIRHPGPRFDAVWYWRANPDVRATGIQPFVHFVLYGRAEGRGFMPLDMSQG